MSRPLLPRLPANRPQRLPLIESEELKGPQVPNLRRVMEHHKVLNTAWGGFAKHVLADQSLPRRDRELAMLRIGWLNQANYEWCQHMRLARRAGVSDEEIVRISEGDRSGFVPHEAAVLTAVDELFEQSTISDATWAALTAHYTTEQVLDLIFTIGQYNLVSWFLNSVGVPLDEGLEAQAVVNSP